MEKKEKPQRHQTKATKKTAKQKTTRIRTDPWIARWNNRTELRIRERREMNREHE